MNEVWVVAGTRPGIIKLAPVYRALSEKFGRRAKLILTGQHTDLARQALKSFNLTPDIVLKPARRGKPASSKRPGAALVHAREGVAALLSELIVRVDAALVKHAPSLVVVQGDTTSAVAAALAAFTHHIPVAHVEAGLRTFDLMRPFPEEAWRSVIGQIASLHFAPTERAARNLASAGIAKERIFVTGNTVIDSLTWLLARMRPSPVRKRKAALRPVLVTLHRREHWQEAFSHVCDAILALRDAIPDIEIFFVAHANPALQKQVRHRLGRQRRVRVLDPLAYPDFVRLLKDSVLVLSDSGGVQEEAPALGIPVLVLRESTERPEAVEEGVAEIVGTSPQRIVERARRLLTEPAAYRQMARPVNPFGDGRAAGRIAAHIEAFLKGRGGKAGQ